MHWVVVKPIAARSMEADLRAEVPSLIAYRGSESEQAPAWIAGGLDGARWDLMGDAAKGTQGLGCAGLVSWVLRRCV